MSAGEIVAIEGVCCAGKTTLVKNLSAHLQAGVIPELPEFGRNLFRPFRGGEEILYNSHQSIGIEKVRMIGAAGLSELAGHVVVDRCFLSTLALSYGAIDIIGTPSYYSLAEAVLAQMQKKEVPLPDKVLYLGIDGQTVAERNLTRVPQLDEYWTDSERIGRQNDFYRRLAPLDGIALVDATQAPQEVLSDCIHHAMMPERISREHLVGAVEGFVAEIK